MFFFFLFYFYSKDLVIHYKSISPQRKGSKHIELIDMKKPFKREIKIIIIILKIIGWWKDIFFLNLSIIFYAFVSQQCTQSHLKQSWQKYTGL